MEDVTLGTDAVAAMFALREFDEVTRSAVVLHPAFRYWHQAMRRCSRPDDGEQERAFARHLVDFVWAEQVSRSSLDRSWTVICDDRGGLRCAHLRRFVELGQERAGQPCVVSPTEQGVEICTGSERIAMIAAAVAGNALRGHHVQIQGDYFRDESEEATAARALAGHCNLLREYLRDYRRLVLARLRREQQDWPF